MPSGPPPEVRAREALADIRDNILLAQEFSGARDIRALTADTRTFYAVVRCLEIISEASRRLDAASRLRHAHLPWRQIATAGNIYRHEYRSVDAEMVWRTVHEALPLLLAAVEAELAG